MSYSHPLAFAIVMTMPLLALAQAGNTRPDPADPDRKSVAPVYQSAFTDYRLLQESGESPDSHWRVSNDEVARVGGHVGIFKDAASDAPAPVKNDEAGSGNGMMQHKH